ncbi:hypothetical protein LCGC14_0735480 [marine sediment metagenome]|uniref:Uncharacterized protein n=1 Tax=marine sediment metagenome TaxID=412755 RepID=A0A0F9STA7_9ZZZZ
MQLVLMYFDTVIGPVSFFSYPGSVLERVSKKMEGFFNLDMKENFFEVSLNEENLKLTSLVFKILSNWGRGSFEMIMLSIISEKDYNTEFSYDILKKYSSKIKSKVNIYKAFYMRGFMTKNDSEIGEKNQELLSILRECYNTLKNKNPI